METFPAGRSTFKIADIENNLALFTSDNAYVVYMTSLSNALDIWEYDVNLHSAYLLYHQIVINNPNCHKSCEPTESIDDIGISPDQESVGFISFYDVDKSNFVSINLSTRIMEKTDNEPNGWIPYDDEPNYMPVVCKNTKHPEYCLTSPNGQYTAVVPQGMLALFSTDQWKKAFMQKILSYLI